MFDLCYFSDLQVQWGFAKLGCGKDIHFIQQSESIGVFEQFAVCNSVGSLGPRKWLIGLKNININQDCANLEFRWVTWRKAGAPILWLQLTSPTSVVTNNILAVCMAYGKCWSATVDCWLLWQLLYNVHKNILKFNKYQTNIVMNSFYCKQI